MPKQNLKTAISISEIKSLRKKAEKGNLTTSDLVMVINLCVLVLRLLQLILILRSPNKVLKNQ